MIKTINGKPWYKSKTIWTAVATVTVSILSAFGVPIPIEVFGVLAAFGITVARTSTNVLTK